MPIVVHHYYPLGSENVGDLMVAKAIRAQVARHFGDASFVDFPVNDRYKNNDRCIGLLGDNLAKTNAQADLVIIGGSNLLEPRKPRRENGIFKPRVGRWSVFTDLKSIESLKPPVMLLGMGNGSSFGKPLRGYDEPASSEIRLLFSKSFAHAVRDQKTVEMLATINVKTICTGCPVTFLTDRPIEPGRSDSPLIVSFPPKGIVDKTFGPSFMRGAMDYLAWLASENVPVIVSLHDSRDIEPAKKQVPKGIEIFWTENLDEQLARLENSRGMIGFRLHAALAAMGVGRPVIPVGLDWRGLAFLQTFGLDEQSIRSMRFGQFKKLRTLTRRLLENDAQLIGTLAERKKVFLDRYHGFLADAARKFAGLRK